MRWLMVFLLIFAATACFDFSTECDCIPPAGDVPFPSSAEGGPEPDAGSDVDATCRSVCESKKWFWGWYSRLPDGGSVCSCSRPCSGCLERHSVDAPLMAWRRK